MKRSPSFAGRFYPGTRADCELSLAEMFAGSSSTPAAGAIVPHAGWIYSGATAALGIGALTAAEPDTIIIFGAVHVRTPDEASLYDEGRWETPLGEMLVDEELAGRIARLDGITCNQWVHFDEHSIEVQLPLIGYRLPEARIVPIMVRPGPWAEAVGAGCAAAAGELGRRVGFLGTSDLTHYGPAFAFEPQGRGADGIRWAKEVNDRRLVEAICELRADGVLTEAALQRSACGAGAIAALIGAMRVIGATRYVELRHTTSAEVECAHGSWPVNSVGYEAGVFVAAGNERAAGTSGGAA